MVSLSLSSPIGSVSLGNPDYKRGEQSLALVDLIPPNCHLRCPLLTNPNLIEEPSQSLTGNRVECQQLVAWDQLLTLLSC